MSGKVFHTSAISSSEEPKMRRSREMAVLVLSSWSEAGRTTTSRVSGRNALFGA